MLFFWNIFFWKYFENYYWVISCKKVVTWFFLDWLQQIILQCVYYFVVLAPFLFPCLHKVLVGWSSTNVLCLNPPKNDKNTLPFIFSLIFLLFSAPIWLFPNIPIYQIFLTICLVAYYNFLYFHWCNRPLIWYNFL